MDYMNTISRERTFITFQGEVLTLEEEKKYMEDFIKKMGEGKALKLLVFAGKKLIGISDITLQIRTSSHVGVFGLTVAKEFRNEGIGRLLMEKVIAEAEKNMPDLRIITLGCFGDNPLAYGLYQKLGFQESGRVPGGIRHNGKYVDHIFMHKAVK